MDHPIVRKKRRAPRMKAGLLAFIICVALASGNAQDMIELGGTWQFAVDSLDRGVTDRWFARTFDETVVLPGSMTENGKGNEIRLSTRWTGDILDSSYFTQPQYEIYRQPGNIKVPFWLQPERHFYGAAWYKRDITIPAGWDGKVVELFLERCHWQSTVWIDDELVGSQNGLGTPHKFDLTAKASPGRHFLTVRVDNRIHDINPGVNASSLTDHSQTNWNGIVGKMYLKASDMVHIAFVRIFPDTHPKKLHVEVAIDNRTDAAQTIHVSAEAAPDGYSTTEPHSTHCATKAQVQPGESVVTLECDMGSDALLWDEFTPNLYRVRCEIAGEGILDRREEVAGLRTLGTSKTQFTLNGRPIFLRGTLECAVFPKTGYPPVDTAAWARIFRICKAYGLNHMRFHSWCPPEAAFVAADRAGIYLQVECSAWANQGSSVGDGKPIDNYVLEESKRIVAEYGNHPSFCFLVSGNEPAGEHQNKILSDFLAYWKGIDHRRLYTAASGWPALPENDYHSMYEPRIQRWAEGLNSIINSQPPNTTYDWRQYVQRFDVPIVSHEIGQWCAYPNFDQIPKYSGSLHPKNFEIFQESLRKHGLEQFERAFVHSSGKLQVLCYKADIEAALRTKGMGGFQMLDLHDFPGQGTALIGVLDAFWDSKGYVTPEEFRQFCNTTVPLARMTKLMFNSAEDFLASIEVFHFGAQPLKATTPSWNITDVSGSVVAGGTFPVRDIPIGNGIAIGTVRAPLNTLASPAMYTLEVRVGEFRNSWNFWVYPYQSTQRLTGKNVRVVRRIDGDARAFLEKGGSILLTPPKGSIRKEFGGDVAVGFSSIFWNTAWTSKQPPHTLGIVCEPLDPLLREFPTREYSDYQWWDAMSHADALRLDSLGRNIEPLVRIIDDWNTNRPLGLLVEAKVGKGKILLSGIDLLTDAEKRPEARQLITSILNYMQSSAFNPKQRVDLQKLDEMYH